MKVLMVGLVFATASCAERDGSTTGSGQKLNPAASVTAEGSPDQTADDPKSGLNTSRPDSSKDLESR
jgi:hypothetical protein